MQGAFGGDYFIRSAPAGDERGDRRRTSVRVLRRAMLLEQAYDLLLLRLRLGRTGSTAPGVPDRELHWRRTVPVPVSHVGSAIEKCTYGGGAPLSD
jgi:hypothetical protein